MSAPPSPGTRRSLVPAIRTVLRTYRRDVVVNRVLASALVPTQVRWRLLRLAGMPLSRSWIPPGTFFGSTKVRLEEGVHIGYGSFFDGLDWVTIGRGAAVGMQALFVTSTHGLGSSAGRAGPSQHAPIVVGEGCWLGARVTVLPGVTVGAGTVVAAGSVVTRDCEPDSLYAGVPAVLKRRL